MIDRLLSQFDGSEVFILAVVLVLCWYLVDARWRSRRKKTEVAVIGDRSGPPKTPRHHEEFDEPV